MNRPNFETLEIIAKRYGKGRVFYIRMKRKSEDGIKELNLKLEVFKLMSDFTTEETARVMSTVASITQEKITARIKQLESEE